jgi:hypothetical protein
MRINRKLMPIKPHLKQNVNTMLILGIGKENYLTTKKIQTSADLASCKREHINLSRAVHTQINKCHTNCIHTTADCLIPEHQ